MIVLSYGFKQPQNGDPGSVWFPALNDNIQRVNDHDHDGTNSKLLINSNFTGGTVSALSVDWVLVVAGKYKQTLTVPTGYNMDDFNLLARLTVSGDIVYPSIEKIDGTTFDIYTSDNTLDYTVIFR